MHAAEVVVHKPYRHGSRMVLNFFRERICQTSETAINRWRKRAASFSAGRLSIHVMDDPSDSSIL